MTSVALSNQSPPPSSKFHWSFDGLQSHIAETWGAAALSYAMTLVCDAQAQGEPVAWVTSTLSHFFPPDAAAAGCDLQALAVVRVPHSPTSPLALHRATEQLARSNGFGLIIADVTASGQRANLPPGTAARLSSLARKHALAVVYLRAAPAGPWSSLHPLVSRCGHAQRLSLQAWRMQTLKAKGAAPDTWQAYVEPCYAPMGVS